MPTPERLRSLGLEWGAELVAGPSGVAPAGAGVAPGGAGVAPGGAAGSVEAE